jgi:hypothetical protein
VSEDLERAIGPDRRTFVKRLVMGSVFAAPVVSSFTLSGVKAVFGTSGGIGTLASNSNTMPPAPALYPDDIDCFDWKAIALDETFNDPANGNALRLQVPGKGTFASFMTLCVYGGDLAALATEVPAGETPVSAYAVVWRRFNSSSGSGDVAASPVMLTVTDPAVVDGNTIYRLDESGGAPVDVGDVTEGDWEGDFTTQPARFVVTQVDDPAALSNYPVNITRFPYDGTALDQTVPDGSVSLHLEVPANVLPPGTTICIYRGDLTALDAEVPADEEPVSGYAVVWSSPGSNHQPDATSPITLTVTDPSTTDGDTIYRFDKTTGDPVSAGTVSGGSWVVTFVEDPGFVVTTPQQVPPTTTPPPATGPGTTTPVVSPPDFTG